jgi:proteasome assembly chaperone (PAC2) family protein
VDEVRWRYRPQLERPVVVCAFAGWNDAADAATTAVSWLQRTWGGRRFADVDPEEFFDFTSVRPLARWSESRGRRIEWPLTTMAAAAVPGAGRDVIVVQGTEPQLRWRRFSQGLVQTWRELGAEMVVTLGALLADVPHSRPVRVTGSAPDPELAAHLRLRPSRYQGPTGIIGVIGDACAQAKLSSVALWASVPHYLGRSPSPRAALALVERAAWLLGGRADTTDLQLAAAAYDRQVKDLVADDDDLSAYVARLEAAVDRQDQGETSFGPAAQGPLAPGLAEAGSAERLAEEAERFLRDLGS